MNKIRKLNKQYNQSVKLSYQEAKDIGYVVYWSGQECIRGHLAHRYVNNHTCVTCNLNRVSNNAYKDEKKELQSVGINIDIRRRIENAQIDAFTVVDDLDY